MTIKSISKIDTTEYGYPKHDHVYAILVEVEAAKAQQEASSLLSIVTDTSWVNNFDAIDKASLLACAQPTIDKIINSILAKVGNKIEKEFGEYLISYSAQLTLVDTLSHKPIPLPEFYKEKISGNPGFDFHTVSSNDIIVFGEAKYNSAKTPYDDAESQVNDFLQMIPPKQKHIKELKELRKFTGDIPATNVINNHFGVTAAFSIHAKKAELAMKNSIKYQEFKKLLDNDEIYVIGVHII